MEFGCLSFEHCAANLLSTYNAKVSYLLEILHNNLIVIELGTFPRTSLGTMCKVVHKFVGCKGFSLHWLVNCRFAVVHWLLNTNHHGWFVELSPKVCASKQRLFVLEFKLQKICASEAYHLVGKEK
jgi:hypothetical protein